MEYPEPPRLTQPGQDVGATDRPALARLAPVLLVVGLVLAGAALLAVAVVGRSARERAAGTPTAPALASPTPPPVAAAPPSTVASRALLTPAVLGSSFGAEAATRTPVPSAVARLTQAPTNVPAERVSLELSAEVDPPVPRVGSRLSIRLSMKNVGRQDIQGVQILTGGPWEVMSGVEVTPQGTLRRGPSGWYILSDTLVPSGETRVLEISGVPLERGNQAFTFLADALLTRDR